MHNVNYYLTLLPFWTENWEGGWLNLELEFADVIDKGSQYFFFQIFLPSSFMPMCRTNRATSFIHAFIYMWNQRFYFFHVTSILGFLEVQIAELRAVANHKKEKKRKEFSSWAICRTHAQDPSPLSWKYSIPVIHACLSWVSKYMANAGKRMVYAFNWIIVN